MGWGMKQLRGILSDFEGHSNVSGKVQVMNLVLVDNLKVLMNRTASLAVLFKHIFLVKLIFCLSLSNPPLIQIRDIYIYISRKLGNVSLQ